MGNKYSVILGNLGNTRDRFCNGYKNNPSTLEMLQMVAKNIPEATGIELVGTWDIHPGNVSEIKKALQDNGLQCIGVIPDTFTRKEYGKGSFTNKDKQIRRQAIDYCKEISEISLEMGCGLNTLWLGQDGYDYILTTDYNQEREWLKEACYELAGSFPEIQFSLEYKPKEPRNFSYHARMADTILALQEIGKPNVGVTIDTGHAFMAGENVAEAIVLAYRAGNVLRHMHFNDNHGSWDDDMIVGSVHFNCYIEILFWLKKTGYNGWLSMDQYPYREDAAGAISESIKWLKAIENFVELHYGTLHELISQNDAVATQQFIRNSIFKEMI
jgi:xylose isomerase